MGSGGFVIVAALASGRDRSRLGYEAAGTRNHGFCADVINLIGVVHVAGGAIAQIARESNFLIIRSSQDIGVSEILPAVYAVNLPRKINILIRSAVFQRGMVAEY